jgi:hypothetical protein
MRGDVSKLPKWAQAEIGRLERDLADARAKLAAGPEESDTFADVYGAPRPLGKSPVIRFTPDPEHPHLYVDAYVDRGSVYVRGSEGLAIRPWAGNVIKVKPERWS